MQKHDHMLIVIVDVFLWNLVIVRWGCEVTRDGIPKPKVQLRDRIRQVPDCISCENSVTHGCASTHTQTRTLFQLSGCVWCNK